MFMVLFLTIFNNNLKSFEYKAKLLGNTVANGENEILRNTTITVPLKYVSNFWGSLKMPLINCEIEMNKILNIMFCLQLVLIMLMLILIILFYNERHKILCSCSSFISKRQS